VINEMPPRFLSFFQTADCYGFRAFPSFIFFLNVNEKAETKASSMVTITKDGNSGIITSTVTVAVLAALLPAKSITIKLTVYVPTLE